MARITNLERKGQYILNRMSEQYLYNVSNVKLTKLLEEYDAYLIHHLVCPKCLRDMKKFTKCECGFGY